MAPQNSSLSLVVTPYKQLFRTALIAIPVMMIISFIMPLLLEKDFASHNPLPGFLMVLSNQIILWGINLTLLRLFTNEKMTLLRYFVSAFITFGLTLTILSIVFYFFSNQLPDILPSKYIPVFAVQINNIAVFLIIELVVSRFKQKQTMEANLELVRSNLEAKQGQLMQQLKPHFLFNSLNTLRYLIHEDTTKAETYLLKLSNILRYSINSKNNDLISLKEEMSICYQFLEIQQIRHDDSFFYTVDLPLDQELIFLPVFGIQLLIENALKHNKNTKQTPLRLKIQFHNNYVEVVNTKNKLERLEESSGIGLINLTERCRHMIGKELLIHESETHFSVKIPVVSYVK